MATALFITTKDMKRYSVLSGNVDPDKFIYMVDLFAEIMFRLISGSQDIRNKTAKLAFVFINSIAYRLFAKFIGLFMLIIGVSFGFQIVQGIVGGHI